ncbi:hypothetical protein A2U01_0085982 [Trifolium medium]|uniref:Uncharacterized protein n=1 Tax=Trifolium medium TaxID=97028 RepID=A0A392TVK2_9FABA|nr:hypothetical protein [Trifolium medium]
MAPAKTNQQACGAHHKPSSARKNLFRPFHRAALATPNTSPTPTQLKDTTGKN